MPTYTNRNKINYALLQNSKLKFLSKKNKSIYHYTSVDGLKNILFNRSLYFTNVKYLNDKDEILAGLESFGKIFNMPKNEIKKYKLEILNSADQIFVCCFSLDKDSLPMWNYYTKENSHQGYNIEFNQIKLIESILRNNPILDGCDFCFGLVDYSANNYSKYAEITYQQMQPSFELNLNKFLFQIAKSNLKKKNSDSFIKELREKIKKSEQDKEKVKCSSYYYNGEKCCFEKNIMKNPFAFIKRDYFKDEKEFRIVVKVPREILLNLKRDGVYKFRSMNGILLPYLELKFNENAIKSITISSTLKNDMVKTSIKEYVDYCGYQIKDFSTFIKQSKIPIRY